jgi:CheY-like chemotaxis protein
MPKAKTPKKAAAPKTRKSVGTKKRAQKVTAAAAAAEAVMPVTPVVATPSPTTDGTPAPSGPKILIIEDERPLAHAMQLKLGHEGYDITTAATGVEGLRLAETNQFHLILLDMILPEMDGFSILEAVQGRIGSKIIVLSNLGQDEDKIRAKALGAIDYLVKASVPLGSIVQVVHSVLDPLVAQVAQPAPVTMDVVAPVAPEPVQPVYDPAMTPVAPDPAAVAIDPTQPAVAPDPAQAVATDPAAPAYIDPNTPVAPLPVA